MFVPEFLSVTGCHTIKRCRIRRAGGVFRQRTTSKDRLFFRESRENAVKTDRYHPIRSISELVNELTGADGSV